MVCTSCDRDNPPDAAFCNGCGGRLAAPAEPELPAGRPLPAAFAGGRYRVESFLGEGGRKRVYLAQDTKLDRSVAIAVIKTDGLDPDALTRVRREAQSMARLGDHPNIVTVFDIGDEEDADASAEGQPYIVSQYMDGGDVTGLLQQAPDHRLPLEDTLRIAGHVCAGLEHAHGKGIIHRDLKPGNVWLGVDGAAKLGDFGLAVALDRSRLTMEGMMVGTVAYIAPEQALGRRPDARSDLYSLGCMLYEMVTGRPPFLGDDAVAVIGQHINTSPVVPSWHNPETPRDLEALILQLLEKDPEKRPASATVVSETLARVTPAPHTGLSSIGPTAAASADAPTYRRTFIGREAELRQLQASFESASSGQGALVMVVGEPGIGKTSVCEQLSTYAAVRGGRTLVGHCYEEGSLSLAYLPFIEVMRSYVLTREGDDLRTELGSGAADVARIVSEVRDRVDVEAVAPASPEEERYRLFQAVTSFLRNASNAQPLVIVLEDLHDADRGTLDLLIHLARYLAGSRLLIIGTYRDVEVDRTHALSSALVELRRSANYDRIALRGLTADEVQRMLASIAGQDIPWGLAEAVFRQTEGNPLFVQEVTRYLAEEGLVTQEGGRWRSTTEQLALSIPEGLRDVVGKRLSRLSESCNRLLAIASVIGREFSLATLQAVAAIDEDALLEALEEAVRVGVLEERSRAGDVRYRFAHAFFRQSLYEEMIAPRRIRMHQQVAQALEQQYAGRLEEHAAELAEHFSYSSDVGDLGKAVEYGVMAAQRASAVYAHGEAAALYGRALDVQEVLDPTDHAKRCDLLLDQFEPRRLSGDIDGSRSVVLEAAEIARGAADNVRLVRAADASTRQFGIIGIVDAELHALLLEALPHADTERDPGGVRILARVADYAARDGDLGRARVLADQAYEAAMRLGEPGAIGMAAMARLLTSVAPWQLEERYALAKSFDEAVTAAGDPEQRAMVFSVHMGLALFVGDIAEANRRSDQLAEMVERYKLTLDRRTVLAVRAEMCRIAGELEEAERLSREATDALGEINWSLLSDLSSVGVGPRLALFAERGKLDEFAEGERASFERFPDWRYAPARGAMYYAFTEDKLECRSWYERLLEFGREGMLADNQPGFLAACAAEACVFLEDADNAGDVYELIAPFAGYCLTLRARTPGFFGPADRYLGTLAALLKRWDDAEKHFAEAIAFCRKMPSPSYLAQTQYDLALMLIRRGSGGDKESALKLLAEAGDSALRMGMVRLAKLAAEAKARAQGIGVGDIQTSIDAVLASVDEEQPDLAAHASSGGAITIMFTDIEASTQINHRLGDQRWMKVLRPHNKIIRDQVKKFGGHEVKGGGDGFMIVFQDAIAATRCALGIQAAMAAHDWVEAGGEDIRVRIGLHTGEAVREAGDFYGRDVNMAARVADQASGAEIVVSAEVKALVGGEEGFMFGEARATTLKGLPGEHEIWPVMSIAS